MKRSIEALLAGRKVALRAAAATFALAAAAPAAHAVSPVAKVEGSVALTQYAADGVNAVAPATFPFTVTLSTDTPGAELFTVQKAVILFPDRAGTNGRRFRSCSAAQLTRFHGAIGRCPAGSKIGSGTIRAQALQLGITVPARVALFNGPGGRSVTFNIQATNPAAVNESIDAPLVQTSGRYGERLTLVVPHSLQEIIPDVFVGLQTFDVTIDGATRSGGVTYSYLRARTCPRRTLRAIFDMKDWTTGQTATATADTKVRCTSG